MNVAVKPKELLQGPASKPHPDPSTRPVGLAQDEEAPEGSTSKGFDVTLRVADLRRAVTQLGGLVGGRKVIPILQYVALDADPAAGVLRLTATDMDLWPTLSLPCSAMGSAPVRTLAYLPGLSRLLRGGALGRTGEVRLRVEPEPALRQAQDEAGSTPRLDLTPAGVPGDGLRLSVPAWPAHDVDDFPAAPDVDGKGPVIALPGPDMAAALAAVLPCVSAEETRYYLNGVCLEAAGEDGGTIVAVATDGHRLAAVPLGAGADLLAEEGTFAPGWSAILPRKLLRWTIARARAMDPSGPPARLVFHAHLPRLRIELGDGCRLATKLIDGTYPDWRKITNRDGLRRFTVPREPLLALARTAAGLAPGRTTPALRMTFWPRGADGPGNSLAVSCFVQDVGEVHGRVPVHAAAEADGSAPTSYARGAVNARYLREALAALPGDADEVTIAAPPTDPKIDGWNAEPIRIEVAGDAAGTVRLLMPMRV